MPEFFKVVTPAELFESMARFSRLPAERAALADAPGRVLAERIVADQDLPPAPRSVMDGYAVKAADTFGATDAVPAFLAVSGSVLMGSMPGFGLEPGRAAEIPTGGFLPDGADAVVMVEYTNRVSDDEIEITRPVTAGENVMARADDVAAGEEILPPGRRLRPHDAGMLAALGRTEIDVFRRPAVAIISTGDEVVPVEETPAPGQVRDINTHGIGALARTAGARVITMGIVRDEPGLLRAALEQALGAADVAVISGGSSVGERDHMVGVVSGFDGAEILAHGIAVRPGKPTLLADVCGKPVFGLPGHPVSALVVAQAFLMPFLKYIEGEELAAEPAGRRVAATLAVSAHSPHGREEYVRVRLSRDGNNVSAHPVFGKSGMLTTLVRADGFFVIPVHSEGVAAGETVDVFLF